MEIIEFTAGIITLVMFFVEYRKNKHQANVPQNRRKTIFVLIAICLFLTPIVIFTEYDIRSYLVMLWFLAAMVWLVKFLYDRYFTHTNESG